MDILKAVLVLGGLGILFGALLGVAAIVFYVKEDKRIAQITELLPGANCGGCGFAGCANLATAITKGEAAVTACPGCSSENTAKIAEIMGVDASDKKQLRAYVKCSGKTEIAKEKYIYSGVEDCLVAARLGGGMRACASACLGLGTCVKVCPFDAISVKDGVAVVDESKCIACGKCITACPKGVIELVPADATVVVSCHNKDKGALVNKLCSVGCIGCKMCEKACPVEAIKVEDNLAVIDYDKCIGCGACKEKCPRKIIL